MVAIYATQIMEARSCSPHGDNHILAYKAFAFATASRKPVVLPSFSTCFPSDSTNNSLKSANSLLNGRT